MDHNNKVNNTIAIRIEYFQLLVVTLNFIIFYKVPLNNGYKGTEVYSSEIDINEIPPSARTY